MCSEPGGLVVAQLAQRPERVRHGAGGDQQDLAVGLRDRVAQRAAEAQVVLHVGGLADPDADPALVGQAVAEELPDVRGGVEDRQVVVLDRGDPGAVLGALARDQVRKVGVAGEVVGPLAHAARQLLGGEQPGAALLRGDDELHRRRPVRVEHHDGVVVEGVEDLAPQLLEPGDQGAVLAAVELAARGLGKHDRGHVGDQPGPYHLAHQASVLSGVPTVQPVGLNTLFLMSQ